MDARRRRGGGRAPRTAMDRLRLPFFIAAVLCLLLAVAGECSANALIVLAQATRTTVEPTGFGIPYLALIDGLLLFTVLLIALPLVLPHALHARVQGLATLILSLLVIIGGVIMVLVALVLLLMMVSLLMAVPFGTIIYMAAFADFSTGQAEAALGVIMLLKLVAAVCLVLAQQRFLQNKGLVLIVLTALLANLVVSFLHNLVPGFLVSITDAIAAIIVAILAIIWAVVLLIGSIPAVIKAIK